MSSSDSRPPEIRARPFWIAVAIMSGLIVAVRVELLRLGSWEYAFDSEGYVRLSERTTGLLDATAGSGLYTFQPPIYPLVVTLYRQLGARSIDQYRLWGVVIGVVLFVATLYLTRELFSTRTALILGGLWLVSINLANGDLNLHPESLASLWLVLSIITVLKWLDTRRWQWAVAVGLVGGCAALTRGELIALIPVSALVVLVAQRQTLKQPLTPAANVADAAPMPGGMRSWARPASVARATAPVALVIVAATAVMAPWWVATSHLTGAPVLTTTGGTTHITFGSCQDTFYRDEFAYSSWNCLFPRQSYFSFEQLESAGITADNPGALDDGGESFIRDNLGDFPAVMVGRLGRTTGVYVPQDQARRTQIVGEVAHGLGMWVWIEWVVICLLAVPGAVALWHRSRGRLGLIGLFVAPTLVAIAVGVGFTRYRTVFLPFVMMLAAGGIAAIVMERRVSRNVAVGMAALGLLFGAGRLAEAAEFDPIHPIEDPAPLTSEFGLGPGLDPSMLLGPQPAELADGPADGFRSAPTQDIRVDTDAGHLDGVIVSVDPACGARVGLRQAQRGADDGIVVGYRDEANYTLIEQSGPYLGWQVVAVVDGDPTVVASSPAPNRGGWLTVEANAARAILFQGGTPLVWYDAPEPLTNVGVVADGGVPEATEARADGTCIR